MKIKIAIINRLKQRKHLQDLVDEMQQDINESIRIKERYKKTIKLLNFELMNWDNFCKKNLTNKT